MNDLPFSIEQVANLLQLQVKRKTPYQMYVNCPFCLGKDGNSDKTGHLNINLTKDVFRCNRCNIQGGILDLYSLYFNTDRGESYNEIIELLKMENNGRLPKRVVNIANIETAAEATIEEKDNTYSKLLGLLSLTEKHKYNLAKRGFDNSQIIENSYRTTPVTGLRKIALTLLENGCKLKGVPGFYTDENGDWKLDIRGYGIMIPVRDAVGKIQGMQIRHDSEYSRKYAWLTSVEKCNGMAATSQMHYANMKLVSDSVFITEGPLKADIASAVSNKPFIAIPGTSCYELINKNAKVLKWYGVKTIVNAMDMDRYTNKNVIKNVEKMKDTILNNGFRVIDLKWDSKFKGIDDYLISKKEFRI